MNGSIISLSRRLLRTTALVTLLAGSVAGCNTLTRLSQVGDDPKITPIQNPTGRPDYKPVSMPMPAPKIAERNPNSLWRAGARAFFKDLRAKQVGDIMTVQMTLSDSATLENKTERDRIDSEAARVTNLLGFEVRSPATCPTASTRRPSPTSATPTAPRATGPSNGRKKSA